MAAHDEAPAETAPSIPDSQDRAARSAELYVIKGGKIDPLIAGLQVALMLLTFCCACYIIAYSIGAGWSDGQA